MPLNIAKEVAALERMAGGVWRGLCNAMPSKGVAANRCRTTCYVAESLAGFSALTRWSVGFATGWSP